MSEEFNCPNAARNLIYSQKVIQRKEDMSPDGSLTLSVDIDNGIQVVVIDEEGNRSSVQFCSPHSGGSARTHRALETLMVAMIEDQMYTSHDSRSGDFNIVPEFKE